MEKTHEEIIKIIKDAHEQLKEDYNLLETTRRPLKDSPTLVYNNMTTYCKYTQALCELNSDEIHDATRLALFTNRITVEDVNFCYAQVKAQDEADRAIKRKQEWEQRERENQQRNLEHDLSCIADKDTGERDTIIQQYIDRVERGEITREEIHEKAEAIRRVEFEKRIAEGNAKAQAEYEAAKAEYEAAQAAEQAEQERIAEEERQAVEEYLIEVNASTQEYVEKALREIKEAETEEETPANTLLFRGKPIEWVVSLKSYNKKVKDPFDGAITTEERVKQINLISYEGKSYEREKFYQAYFGDYKKHAYKVKFKNDDVLWLSSSQRAKLSYHILAQNFDLSEVAEEDKRDLEQLAANKQEKTYNIWRDRMKWEKGHELMITFGAALDVRMKKPDGKYTSAAKGVYCYESKITEDYAKYKSVCMSWESWSTEIKRQLDLGRYTMYRCAKEDYKGRYRRVFAHTMRQATIAMYHQNGVYLTLLKEKMDTIEEWIKKYFKDGKTKFPYKGDIPNADISFTIDFASDIEIVKTQDLKNNMPEYNKVHNAEHNREVIGRNKVIDTFSRLTGDEWSRAEILAQGFNGNNITRFVEYGLIERTGRGQYKRKT